MPACEPHDHGRGSCALEGAGVIWMTPSNALALEDTRAVQDRREIEWNCPPARVAFPEPKAHGHGDRSGCSPDRRARQPPRALKFSDGAYGAAPRL